MKLHLLRMGDTSWIDLYWRGRCRAVLVIRFWRALWLTVYGQQVRHWWFPPSAIPTGEL